MHLPDWLPQVLDLSLSFSRMQELGLAFLLGSFTVGSLSDLRRMTMQYEFLEIWAIFVVGVLALDTYEAWTGRMAPQVLAVKWGLILLLSVLSLKGVGILFRLAVADVAALAAAASLLKPVLVVVLYLVAKVLTWGIGPYLARGRKVWPFMPVVTLATLLVLMLGLFF